MTNFEINNKIHEIRSLIASNWPSIEERQDLYKELKILLEQLKKQED